MKKVIIGLLLLCTVFLGGCDSRVKSMIFANLIQGDLPTAYAPSNWASHEPEISFSIDDNLGSQDPCIMQGNVIIDGKAIDVKVSIDELDYAFEIYVEKSDSIKMLLLGYFISSDAESFSVSVIQDNLFGGEYDEIVFYRQ